MPDLLRRIGPAALARADTDGDPLARALPALLWAGYDARPYAPTEMPDGERAAYADDFARRLSASVVAEADALARMEREDAKDRLRSLAAAARQGAREAAGY